MTTLDANVLISLWDSNPSITESASRECEHFQQIGAIGICGPVFSELLGFPGRTDSEIRQLLSSASILVDWNLIEPDWQAAGQAYQGYVDRRRKSGGGLPRRMATDFLVGAYAYVRGYTLLTLDKGLYRAAFPNLKIESF